MPIGEAIIEGILELLFRLIVEIVFYGLGYWTGFAVLKTVSFGRVPLAPFMTISDKNPRKRKWHESDWSIWLHRPKQRRALKAEFTCSIGVITWIVIGITIGIYLSVA